jgi:C-3',4' desaturase CrtD
MKNKHEECTDAIVIGSGMGGLSIAGLLTKDGIKTTVLEAAHVPGGCSSSFKRKGFIFESGATTLIGFDKHQPLNRLEKLLGITIPKVELNPSMTVHIKGEECIRYKEREEWINEAGRVFGNPEGQKKFWELCFRVSDVVWKVSEKNVHFPPESLNHWTRLAFGNNPLDAYVLLYANRSVYSVIRSFNIDTPEFTKFIDEQLMITAQAESSDVPFLFGAAGITYTNYSNYYVEGGLIEMIRTLEKYISDNGSQLLCKRKVIRIDKEEGGYVVETESGDRFKAPLLYSNIPIWNMSQITEGDMNEYFTREAGKYQKAWGAFTMGIVTSDQYDGKMTLHHQIHLKEPMKYTGASSVFVSMSKKGDTKRASENTRTLNISCHTPTLKWFDYGEEDYDGIKSEVEHSIVEILKEYLPGFSDSELLLKFSSTPVTWQNWVYRYQGRVGGIPQSMERSLLDWSKATTPFEGLYLCGDTVYPGQGIPGVTLSGINVYYKSEKIRKKLLNKN